MAIREDISRMERELNTWEQEITTLGYRASEEAEIARKRVQEEYTKRIDELRKQKDEARKRLDEMRKLADEAEHPKI